MKQRKKKKKDPTGPIKPWAALMTWLILNLIWFALSPMATPHPVLSEEGGYREKYFMTVPDFLGADLPFEVECNLYTSNSDFENTTLTWTLWEIYTENSAEKSDNNAGLGDSLFTPTKEWSGKIGEDCSEKNSTILPGEYELEIHLYYEDGKLVAWEDAAEVIEGDFIMMYWIYAPHVITGYILANVIGIVILLTDQATRRWKRAKILAKRLPIHKQRHKEEWDSLHEQMEGGGDATVESFEIELGSASEAREEMRKRFEESVDDTEESETPEIEEVPHNDEKLGEGDISGLEGETKVDKDIKTVGDLWERMKDDDEDF